MDEPRRAVTFDELELLFLEHRLRPSETACELRDGLLPPCVPGKGLCLKVGLAWLMAAERHADQELSLTETECWILHERVSPFDSCPGRQAAGLSIVRKLLEALLAFDADRALGRTLPAVAAHQEQSAREVKDALEARDDHNPDQGAADRQAGD